MLIMQRLKLVYVFSYLLQAELFITGRQRYSQTSINRTPAIPRGSEV